MHPMTISGRAPRCFYHHVSENIECGSTPNMQLFKTIVITDNNTKAEVTEVCCNLLMLLTEGQPIFIQF